MLVAPTNKVGMATPLQDIFKLNVAGVLARQENLPEPAPIAPFYQVVDGSSMLMSDHVLKALSLFRHIVEIQAPEDASKRSIVKMLEEKDEASMTALQKKVQGKWSQRGMTNEKAAETASIIIANTELLPRRTVAA